MEQANDEVKSKIPLPDELLSEIISRFIPLCEWSHCLEKVSKQFQRCVRIAYGRMKSIDYRKLFSLKRPFHVADRFNFIWMNHSLEKLLTVCPNLADIARSDISSSLYTFGRSITWEILAQFDRLQSISLKWLLNTAFQPFANFVENSNSLKILNVSSCEFDSCGTLDIGSLSVVKFCYNTKLESDDRANVCFENLSEKLTCLTLDNLYYALKNPVDAMKNCKNLESLSVNLLSEKDYEVLLQTLPNLCKLTNLHLNGYGSHIPFVFDGQYFYDHLHFLKNQLQCIEFNAVAINEKMQHFLLSECLQLESLILSGLSDNVLSANIASLPGKLKKLTFSNDSSGMLKIFLPNLVKLTNFTELTITGIGDRFDRKLVENIACLVNLQKLRFVCGIIDDSLLESWDNKNPEMFLKLVSFQIGWHLLQKISDRGAILLAKKARNLKVLCIFGSRISEKTIFVLADVAKMLQSTNLYQSYPFFDENAVIHLIKNVVSLKSVRVNEGLVDKICGNEKFASFAEIVEIKNGSVCRPLSV